ncbi:hypothetical protein [Vibrio sp. D431a]|uniref:hypothetical protein n=1 Tax=Vibrio sp. D431a TaxID=2837388 RepID=UPI002557089C|nr:hypothetical protein [Vibrio sp. D431a]MDK9790182.1 hypothetical protein [Vibrio sp. D431a]
MNKINKFFGNLGAVYLARNYPEIYREISEIRNALERDHRSNADLGHKDQLSRLAWCTEKKRSLSLSKGVVKTNSNGYFFNKNVYFARITIDAACKSIDAHIDALRDILRSSIAAHHEHEIEEFNREYDLARKAISERHHFELVLVHDYSTTEQGLKVCITSSNGDCDAS